jgi:transglutaminase-like putative cysteine protease
MNAKGGCSPQNNLQIWASLAELVPQRKIFLAQECVRGNAMPYSERVKLRIFYETTYEYQRAVHFSSHHLRVIPRGDAWAQLLGFNFETEPPATTRLARDAFDNVVASFSFADAAKRLELKMVADVEVTTKNPFDFILDAPAVEVPFTYERDFSSFLRVFTRRQSRGVIALPGWVAPNLQSRRGTVQTLVELTRTIHKTIQYERREEGRARSPAETLRRKRGACRDAAVLLAEILRSLGLAARIVSGYLREADDTIHRAERSLHAWTEVFLPGAGWIGLDSTNGIFCDHNFITTAVGVRPAHVTPISGNFYHRERVPSRMTSRVELINLSANSGNVE